MSPDENSAAIVASPSAARNAAPLLSSNKTAAAPAPAAVAPAAPKPQAAAPHSGSPAGGHSALALDPFNLFHQLMGQLQSGALTAHQEEELLAKLEHRGARRRALEQAGLSSLHPGSGGEAEETRAPAASHDAAVVQWLTDEVLAAVRVTDEEEVLAAAEEQASAGAKQHSATSPGHASCADSLRLTTPAGGGGAGAHCCEHSDLAPGQLISYPFCLEEAPAAGFTARQSDGEAESGAAQPAPEEEPAEPPSPGQLQREQQTLEAAGDLAVALTFGYCRRRVLDDVRSMVEHALSKAAASEDSPSLRDAPPRPTCWGEEDEGGNSIWS